MAVQDDQFLNDDLEQAEFPRAGPGNQEPTFDSPHHTETDGDSGEDGFPRTGLGNPNATEENRFPRTGPGNQTTLENKERNVNIQKTGGEEMDKEEMRRHIPNGRAFAVVL